MEQLRRLGFGLVADVLLLHLHRMGPGPDRHPFPFPQAFLRQALLAVEGKAQIRRSFSSGQTVQQKTQIAAQIPVQIAEGLQLLGGGAGVAAHLPVNFRQIVALHALILLLNPVELFQQIAPARFHRVAPPVLERRLGHGFQYSVVLQPLAEHLPDGHPVLGDGVADFQWPDIRLHDPLAEVVKVGRQHIVDVLHFHLHAEKALDVVVDGLQCLNQGHGVVVGAVEGQHFLIGAVPLPGHLQGRIGAEHIGIAPLGRVLPQLVEQFQQTAAVAGNNEIFLEAPLRLAPLLFKPPAAAQLADEKPRLAGDVPQLLLIDVLAVKGGVSQLPFHPVAQNGIIELFRNFQMVPVRLIQHLQRLGIQCPVGRRQNGKQVLRHGFKQLQRLHLPNGQTWKNRL